MVLLLVLIHCDFGLASTFMSVLGKVSELWSGTAGSSVLAALA
jgi:hypothetical protein